MREGAPNMTDAETVAHLRAWKSRGAFAWPTDACGYEQHIRFVTWRNERIRAGEEVDILVYADALEAGQIAPYRDTWADQVDAPDPRTEEPDYEQVGESQRGPSR